MLHENAIFAKNLRFSQPNDILYVVNVVFVSKFLGKHISLFSL